MSWNKRGPRPDGEIRRSQLLTSAGPGALVDLVKHAAIVGQLDYWHYRHEKEGFFSEPRLQAKALRMLKGTGHWDHSHVRLRLPPECDDDDPNSFRGINVVEFPAWYLCQNDRCRSLVHRTALPDDGRHECAHGENKSFPVVPVRFVAACPQGHIMDINWRHFVHRGQRPEDLKDSPYHCHRRPGSGKHADELGDDWTADLYMLGVGTSGDMTDYIVGCRRCGATRGLQDLVQKGVLGTCLGWRPWLGGRAASEQCSEQARMLTRTATNAYFPFYISVLHINDSGEALRKRVDELWSSLKRIDTLDKLQTLVDLIDEVAEGLSDFEPEDVLGEIKRRNLGLPIPTPPPREAEWREFFLAPPEIPGELPSRNDDWFVRRLDSLTLPTFIDRVVLVHAMKEVRAQIGFTRLEGLSTDPEGEYSLANQAVAPLALRADWIPAVEIKGEGVFIAFDERAVREWEARPAVRDRVLKFKRAHEEENRGRQRQILLPSSYGRLLMLHSLAHLLITAISLECGYPASSIRERIYCYRDESDDPEEAVSKSRAGILLYTGTPGSEGTLGGLVEVGRSIITHLQRAAEMGQLCSNDPVCAQHDPSGMEEGRHREGAACHACLLIAEPSCERMNRDLDRTMVVETVERLGASFLPEASSGSD